MGGIIKSKHITLSITKKETQQKYLCTVLRQDYPSLLFYFSKPIKKKDKPITPYLQIVKSTIPEISNDKCFLLATTTIDSNRGKHIANPPRGLVVTT